MKKSILFFTAIFMFSAIQIDAYAQRGSKGAVKYIRNDFPEVPIASAYEAYLKYKAGKAIIIHTGGQSFKGRRIVGALNLPTEAVRKGKIKLPRLPKRGIEIFTYCY